MAKKLSDEELVNVVRSQMEQSVGFWNGELSSQRQKAMRYYYGEPFGDEVEGLSTYVSRDVLDVVESLMPQLVKIFVASDEIVKFEAQTHADEPQAQQATDYVNYIFFRKNPGFMVVYNALKDGLLQKNAFVKVYWEEYAESKKDRYENLSEMEFTQLVTDSSLEIVEWNVDQGEDGSPLYSLVVRSRKEKGKVCIESVPPEEMLIARGSRNDIQKANYVAQRMKKTLSDLKEMGYSTEDLPDFSEAELNQERITRFGFDEEIPYPHHESSDPSMREVWVTESYLRVDRDGDGIAELRKVTTCGTKLLDDEEVDRIPFVSGTPIPIPHKFFGMSEADLCMDIQEIKSFLNRQVLNNAALINHNRYQILDGMVNVDDLLLPRPGGFVRTKALNAITPFPVQPLGNAIFQHIEYFDSVREQRTGVTRYNQGLDADSLNKTASGIRMITDSSRERQLLMARVFGETLFKDLFWSILELVSKHETEARTIRLRDQWVDIDPQQWKNRFDMSVSVGLGTGAQDIMIQGMQAIMGVQEKIAMGGGMGRIVNETNIYQAAIDLARAIQPKKAESYFTNPTTLPPPEPKPDPKVEIAQMKIEAQSSQRSNKMQFDGEQQDKRLMAELLKQAAQQQHDKEKQDQSHGHGMDRAAADWEAEQINNGF
jgi:hypothetical protein